MHKLINVATDDVINISNAFVHQHRHFIVCRYCREWLKGPRSVPVKSVSPVAPGSLFLDDWYERFKGSAGHLWEMSNNELKAGRSTSIIENLKNPDENRVILSGRAALLTIVLGVMADMYAMKELSNDCYAVSSRESAERIRAYLWTFYQAAIIQSLATKFPREDVRLIGCLYAAVSLQRSLDFAPEAFNLVNELGLACHSMELKEHAFKAAEGVCKALEEVMALPTGSLDARVDYCAIGYVGLVSECLHACARDDDWLFDFLSQVKAARAREAPSRNSSSQLSCSTLGCAGALLLWALFQL